MLMYTVQESGHVVSSSDVYITNEFHEVYNRYHCSALNVKI